MERLTEMIDHWYGRLDDLIADLKDAGFSVEEANSEYVTGWDEKENDDIFYTIRLGGTEHTITVDRVIFERIGD